MRREGRLVGHERDAEELGAFGAIGHEFAETRIMRSARSAEIIPSRAGNTNVVQSVRDYEQSEDERRFMRAVVQGLLDLEEGREISLADVRQRLGMV